MKLFVGNLLYTMTNAELGALFSSHGSVVSARIINDHFTRQSKCFGFVKMLNREEGHQAIKRLHGQTINDLLLVVKEERPRDERHNH